MSLYLLIYMLILLSSSSLLEDSTFIWNVAFHSKTVCCFYIIDVQEITPLSFYLAENIFILFLFS